MLTADSHYNMKLHSIILGEGQPFIILHGFLGMSDNWKTLGKKYSEAGYQVHLIDQRNHGRSPHSDDFSYEHLSNDLFEYCTDHNLKNIILLGHSMGGKTAMEFSCSYPDKVERLIVADIAPKYYPLHHQDILDSLSALDFESIQSRKDAEEILGGYINDIGTKMFLLKNLYRREGKTFGLRINLNILTKKVEEIGKPLSKEKSFNKPSLFLKGEKSNYIKETDTELIKNHFPLAKIGTISNGGHWLHAENPTEFYDKSIFFIKN